MAKQKVMKGVSCINRKGVEYWYARINDQKKYCGKGDKGRQLAIAAKSKANVKLYENRQVNVGMKVKKVHFRNIQELSNWYMILPSVQEKKGYWRKLFAVKHLLEYFGHKQITQAEGDDQERYRGRRRSQGAADGTISVEIALLSSMYHLALKRKMISYEAMPGEFFTDAPVNPRPVVSDHDFQGLLDNADTDFKDVLICGYESAMRSSEICSLTAGQVHLDVQHISGQKLNYIDLGIFDTKTGARRTVPVSDKLKSVLERRIEGLDSEDYVFKNSNGKYSNCDISYAMKAVCGKAGVAHGDKLLNKKGERVGIVFHCLRHTRTSKWIEMGFSDEIVRRATGHKSLEAYQRYVKLGPQSVMRLVKDKKSKTDKNGIKSAETLI